MLLPILIFGVILKGGIYDTRAIKFGMSGVRTRSSSSAQSPEETCLSLAHQNPSKTSEKWVILIALIALQFRYTFYRPQTKRLRARKIGLQYKIRKGRKQIWGRFSNPFLLLGSSCLGSPSGDGLRSPFGRRAVRQRGYGLRLLIFKSRSGSDKKRRNRLQ